MIRRRLAAALAAATLLPAVVLLPAVATTAPAAATPAAADPRAAAAMPAAAMPAAAMPAAAMPAAAMPAAAVPAAATMPAAAGARADIPCPKPKVPRPTGIPPRPVPPPDDPVEMKVGGDALATRGLVVPAGAKPPPAITATTWMVADLDSGAVLGACGPHVPQTPASVQKTLLAATVLTKLNPARKITVVPGDLDIEPNSSAVGLVVGGKYAIATLWLGLLLNSGNDAANALARLAGGGGPDGLARTVAEMNATAQRIGAYQTHAVTPSGLDGPGQFTSAYDLALIARVCFANKDFRRWVLTRSAQMPPQPHLKQPGFQFQNENKLIYNYPGAMGGKTGFTTVARHSYVAGAERGGRRLVVSLLGAEARPLRGWQQGAALLDWGFAQPRDASVGRLVTPDDVKPPKPEAPAAEPVTSASAAPIAAEQASRSQLLTVAAAGSVALVLAAAPLVLLLIHRRRRPGRRPL